MGPAIELRGVGKRYTKYDDLPLLVTTMSRMSRRKRRSKMWAVRGIDVEIDRGASFGIIGRNGSGKTTLMSMMAGVTAPTEGFLRITGRIAPLIAVGVGFHHELTGRENVYLNATILGLTKRQIDQRLDAIVDFAEIEEFIDTPVKFYSSGMFVRLGFAVAVHCDPDIVLVDEVLAVGDLGFQVKCLERMAGLVERGTTVVMVSHNMAVLQRLAQRVLLMDGGRPVYLGAPEAAIARFHELLDDQPGVINEASGVRYEPGVVEVISVELLGPDGESFSQVQAGAPITVRLTVRTTVPLPAVAVGYTFTGSDGQVVYMDSNLDQPFGPIPATERTAFTLSMRATLPTGSYSVHAWVQRPLQSLLARSRNVSFYVSGRPTVKGAADLGGLISRDEVPSELPEAVS